METLVSPVVYGGAPSRRSWLSAIARGMARRCPACGRGSLFAGYLKTARACAGCGLDFTDHRADDAPPYVTIMIVGHLAIPLALFAKQIFDVPLALQFAVWTPLTIAATALLLPAVKGGLIGIQWANGMHGFDESARPDTREIEA